jgi:hypothetical protein
VRRASQRMRVARATPRELGTSLLTGHVSVRDLSALVWRGRRGNVSGPAGDGAGSHVLLHALRPIPRSRLTPGIEPAQDEPTERFALVGSVRRTIRREGHLVVAHLVTGREGIRSNALCPRPGGAARLGGAARAAGAGRSFRVAGASLARSAGLADREWRWALVSASTPDRNEEESDRAYRELRDAHTRVWRITSCAQRRAS